MGAPLPLMRPPKWKSLAALLSRSLTGQKGPRVTRKGVLRTSPPPSPLAIGGAPGDSGTDPISNPRRQRDPGAEYTARATRTPVSPAHLPVPPAASWQPPRLSLLSRSPPGARSTSSPSSRPPGHPRLRTPSRAPEQVASETSARQSPLTHPEDEVKSEEQVFDALATSFDRHGVSWTSVGQEARTTGTEGTRQRTETR